MKKVSGEHRAINLPHPGISSKGMKIPLMKTKGNLTMVETIMMLAVMSVGGVDRMAAMEEKQNEASKMPNIRVAGQKTLTPMSRPTVIGTMEMTTPKMKEANTSPTMMAVMDIGADTNLSKVLFLASQGAITGTTEVAVKKRVIPNKPGTRKSEGTFLPTEKDKNRKMGIRTPKMRTGPLK